MKKIFHGKRALSLLLAAILLIALVPLGSLAATVPCPTCSGTGLVNEEDRPDCENGQVEEQPAPVCEHCGEAHATDNCPHWCETCQTANGTHPNSACSSHSPAKPVGCTCSGTTHDVANTECALYVRPKPEGCTCSGATHDVANIDCELYVPPKPDNCTCSGTTHDTANAECPANASETAPDPLVETVIGSITYGEPTLGNIPVSIVWDEDVPIGTSVTFALQYARNDGTKSGGVTAPMTVVNPSNTATFTGVPATVERTTVTNTITTPYGEDGVSLLFDQATTQSESETETLSYTYAPVSANAGAGYKATRRDLSLRISVRPAEEETTSVSVELHWDSNIPADQNPQVAVTLLANGSPVAGTEATLGKANESYGYYELPAKDADGNAIVYTVTAERANTSVDGGFSVSASGLSVTIQWLDTDTANGVIEEITILVASLPTPVPSEDTDPATVQNLAGVRSTLAQIGALLKTLTWAQMEALNIDLYYDWGYYISVADGTIEEGISTLALQDNAEEPDSTPVEPKGRVTFTNPLTHTIPSSVEVKLFQDGILVRSQGVAISGTSGDFTFGSWPSYNELQNRPYTYSVAGGSVANFLATTSPSTADGYAVTYTGLANPSTETEQTYDITVNWDHTGNTAVTATAPTATVTMYKNDVAVSGTDAAATFGPGNQTKPLKVKAKGGDSVRPVPSRVDKYDTVISGRTITYTYVGNKVVFGGTINWINASRFNKPPLAITIEGTHKTTGAKQAIPALCTERMDSDSTTYVFTNAALTSDYTYAITNVTINSTYADDLNYTVSWNGSNITVNRSKDPLMRIDVSVRWIDNNNKRERRPIETTVYLYRDGVYTGDAVQVRAADGWGTVFYDQPCNDGAHVYKYSIRLAKTPYYWTRYTRLSNFGFLATNFYGGWRSGSDTSASLTPKVGDPTLFRSALSDRMYAQAAASNAAVRNAALLNENETVGETVDFNTLKRLNKDVVAWITLSGTSIDYPIVKGSNNTEYLTRLFSGEANSAGSLFMDYHNNSKFSNRNTVIFGHNMQDGTMFNTLLQYATQSFYTSHPAFDIQTPDGDYTAEPIAAFFTDSAYSNVVKRTFATNAAFLQYVDKCIRASSIQTETAVSATDKLVTFVTCDDDYSANRRFLVVCKLSPAN